MVIAERPTAATVDPVTLGTLPFQVDTDRDGLPQNSVESMTLDHDGYLWVCTRDGAAVYNGQHWRIVNMPERTRSNWPRVVLAADDGSLFFGTEGAGLARLRDGHWTTYDAAAGLPGSQVRALAESSNGGRTVVWVGTSAGLGSLEDEHVLAVRDPTGPGGSPVQALLTVRRQHGAPTLWVGTFGNGLFRLADGRWQHFTAPEALPDNRVLSLFVDSEGALWVGTQSGVAQLRNHEWQHYTRKTGNSVGAVHDIAETFGPKHQRTMWFATEGGGLVRFDGSTWNSVGVTAGLPSSYVYSLLAVGSRLGTNTLLVGTLTGLARLELGSWITLDESSGLPDNTVMSLLETVDQAGQPAYWFGTSDGGLGRFDEHGWKIFDRGSGLPDSSVFCLVQVRGPDGQPSLWAGTNQGLARLRGGGWRVWTTAQGLPSNAVVALLPAADADGGGLWVGTYGGGLAHLADDRWDVFDSHHGLPDNRVEALLESQDPGGGRTLWVATDGGLAYRRDGRWEVVDERSGLPNSVVRSLHLSRQPGGRRTLWVGTGGGLAWTDPDLTPLRWHAVTATTVPALPNPVVYRIEEDHNHRLYLSTNRGVIRVTQLVTDPEAPTDLALATFTTDDGLPSSECSFGASMVDRRGRIWVGTVQGAAVLDPALEVPDRTPKPLYIESARVPGRSQPLARGEELLHDQNHVTFSFSLVTFFRSSANRYRSRLQGLEGEPTAWRSEASREFTSLPPGNYVFQVWGRDAAGNVSGPVTFPFQVLPSAWQTWWAWTLYLLVAAGIGYAAVRLRLRTLRLRTEELEQLVAKRTTELAAANQALEEMSVTDPLTEARNRRFLSLTLPAELEQIRTFYAAGRRRPQGPAPELLFFVVDIDRFKEVNDRFGHDAGDRVLQHVCALLRQAMRDEDTVVRWGGEEFLLVARSSSRSEGPGIAERVRRLVSSSPVWLSDGGTFSVTCSVGFAPFPLLSSDPSRPSWEEVVTLADQCMYAVKRSGRNGWAGVVGAVGDSGAALGARIRIDPRTAAARGELTLVSSFDDQDIAKVLGPDPS